jgi:hypothetical protein
VATWTLFLPDVLLDRISKDRIRLHPNIRVPEDVLVELVVVFLFLDE